MNLEHILKEDTFQEIQDDIAEATEIAIITVDYRGKPVTKHSRCTDFCQNMRENPKYGDLCEKCDSRGGLEAVRLEAPYIYVCHAGLIDFAAPIIVDGQYLGAVMAGQVLVSKEDMKNLDHVLNDKESKLDLREEAELDQLFNKVPTMTIAKVSAISKMMFHLSNYIVGEALLKTSLYELSQLKKEEDEIYQKNNEPKEVAKELSKKNHHYKNKVLAPALEHITDHYHENISMASMASLCNISSSYFSKLFRREIKDSFPNYINRIRVEKAKILLKNSDTPIINISLDLGFTDCGYFIKVFKNAERVTPAIYRKMINEENI